MAQSVQNKKTLEVKCNTCNKTLSIPTESFYRPSIPEVLTLNVVTGRKEVTSPKKSINHRMFGGGECLGTLRTVDQRKLKSHKASRDKKARGGQKG